MPRHPSSLPPSLLLHHEYRATYCPCASSFSPALLAPAPPPLPPPPLFPVVQCEDVCFFAHPRKGGRGRRGSACRRHRHRRRRRRRRSHQDKCHPGPGEGKKKKEGNARNAEVLLRSTTPSTVHPSQPPTHPPTSTQTKTAAAGGGGKRKRP